MLTHYMLTGIDCYLFLIPLLLAVHVCSMFTEIPN